MEILEFAMKMERDGKAFYEQAASKAGRPELKKIFTTLAEEELRHFKIFKNLKEGMHSEAKTIFDQRGQTISIAKNLFQQLTEEGKSTLYGDDAKAVWKEAREIEEKSEKMYREEAEKETDATRKELWNKIADEEKNHIYLVDNMISFMNDPQGFTASADFKHFMSWEGH